MEWLDTFAFAAFLLGRIFIGAEAIRNAERR